MLRIGPATYNVRMTHDLDSCWGDVRHDKGLIRVHEDSHDKLALITLFHESMHALGFMFGLRLEEAAVESWAPMLIMFLEDNGIDLDPLYKTLEAARNEDRA
jgi:hypothetical protein